MTRTLFYDIETGCGPNALKADLSYLLVFGWKFSDEDEAHSLSLLDCNGFKKYGYDDRKLLKEASKIFNQADVVCGHYSSRFDLPYIQGRLAINGMKPLAPTVQRDTWEIARRRFKFSSNRLKMLCKTLRLEKEKLESKFPEWWVRAMLGEEKIIRRMKTYCEGDCLATEALYNKIMPFDSAHSRVVEDRSKCGVCAGSVEYRGFCWALGRRYRRFQCKGCGKWGRGTSCVK